MVDLEGIARTLPDVMAGIACAGTALESRTFGVGKKTFLFVSAKEARLKLEASAAEAKRLGFTVGANGWVKLPIAGLPAAAVLRRWVAESHALVAPSAKPSPETAKPRAKRPPRAR